MRLRPLKVARVNSFNIYSVFRGGLEWSRLVLSELL